MYVDSFRQSNMKINFNFKTDVDEKNYQKNLKHVGEVYAVSTKKGYAIAQIGGLDRHGIPICRIFSDLYEDIPDNVENIICKEESYLIIVSLHTMSHWRVKQALKIGKFELPEKFCIPQYFRCFSAFRKENGPFKYWSVVDFEGNILYFKDYIINVLNKKVTDNSWKQDFLKLNSANIFNGTALIDHLEKNFSLENWKPTDFDKKTSEIIKEEQI